MRFCQIEPVYSAGPRTAAHHLRFTPGVSFAVQPADGEHIPSNCKTLEVALFVIKEWVGFRRRIASRWFFSRFINNLETVHYFKVYSF